MTSIDKPDNSSPDADLASLFKTQKVAVPEKLDKKILEIAHEAVNGTKTPSKKSAVNSPWFAMAAMVTLAVFIVPLMLNEPESELVDETASGKLSPFAPQTTPMLSNDSGEAVTGPTVKKAVKSQSIMEESALPKVLQPSSPLNSRENSPSALIESSMDSVAADDIAPTFSADKTELTDSVSNVVMELEEATNFRTTPDTWLSHIQELLRSNRTQDAKREYDLLLSTHPDFIADFVFPNQ